MRYIQSNLKFVSTDDLLSKKKISSTGQKKEMVKINFLISQVITKLPILELCA